VGGPATGWGAGWQRQAKAGGVTQIWAKVDRTQPVFSWPSERENSTKPMQYLLFGLGR